MVSLLSSGWPAAHMLDRTAGRLVRAWMGRPFSRRSRRRALICFSPNRISYSQVYPFLHYASDFAQALDVEFRCLSIDALLAGEDIGYRDVDHVLVQSWFDVDGTALAALLRRLRDTYPEARISFLDSYAHNDLRLGRVIEPFVSDYVKKSLFRDRSLFLRAWRGTTNLTEYYSDLYGITAEPVDWHVPQALLGKLHLAPNFFTDARFIRLIEQGPPIGGRIRDIDIHARLGKHGSGWYKEMRLASLAPLKAMRDLTIVAEGNVPLPAFMAELRRSKLCFSPFGYGELCWRDVEAFCTGSVLVKPDMSHLETAPDLYEPWVTYLPIAWDFSDLEAVVRSALADEAGMARMAETAHGRIVDYIREKRFVKDMGFLFAPGT
ncbi:MAG: glycosyltransferase family 1 protein [Labrys sp. (in: a-proteobacteria)]